MVDVRLFRTNYQTLLTHSAQSYLRLKGGYLTCRAPRPSDTIVAFVCAVTMPTPGPGPFVACLVTRGLDL